MVKNDNFTFLLTSSGQEWQFYFPTGHLGVNNDNIGSLLLTSSAQEWQFYIPADIY